MLARADVVGVRVALTASGAGALARMLLTAAADGVAQLNQDGPGGLTLPIGHGLSRGRWSASDLTHTP
jgi:hypothetical protein